VELGEAFKRIVAQHLWLIACFVIAGLVGAGLVHQEASKTYTSSTRLVLDTQDPKSRTEAAAIADTGQAIATSPAQVRAALSRLRVGRDSLGVADQVSVRPLGTSGVLELSVSDREARTARAIADALAAQVISARREVSDGGLQRILGTINRQIDDLGHGISNLDQAGGAAGSKRDFLAQRQSTLEAERVSLLSTAALRPAPSIISPATLPGHADASRALSILALGAILGLFAGLGVAGLIEMIRPTLVGKDALAREFNTQPLGTLSGAPDEESVLDTPWLWDRIRIAGEAAGVRSVWLLGVGPSRYLRPLATALTQQRDSHLAARRRPKRSSGSSAGASGVPINVFDPHTWSPNGSGAALVLVVPNALKKRQIADANRLVALSRLPVLGVVTYERARSLKPNQHHLDTVVLLARNGVGRGRAGQARIAEVIRSRVPQ
jgi:capsular polysaccharide biosynthesis protein